MYLLLVPVDSTDSNSRYRFACGSPTFSTVEAAEAFRGADRSVGPDVNVTIHRWLGEVRDGQPVFAGDPLAADALFLALPHHGAGCRDEHRPLLKLAERAIGTGLPLDALIGHDSGDPDDWEIDDCDRGEVLSLIVRAADEVDAWEVDDADDYPPAAVEAAIEWATTTEGSPEVGGYEGGDFFGEVHVALFDDEVIGCYDELYLATEMVDQRFSESRHGYPWAWNWAYYLDYPLGSKVVRAIKTAGYTVAVQASTGYLFCGLDAGGLDFDSAYKAPLGAALAHLWYQLIDGAIPVGPAL